MTFKWWSGCKKVYSRNWCNGLRKVSLIYSDSWHMQLRNKSRRAERLCLTLITGSRKGMGKASRFATVNYARAPNVADHFDYSFFLCAILSCL